MKRFECAAVNAEGDDRIIFRRAMRRKSSSGEVPLIRTTCEHIKARRRLGRYASWRDKRDMYGHKHNTLLGPQTRSKIWAPICSEWEPISYSSATLAFSPALPGSARGARPQGAPSASGPSRGTPPRSTNSRGWSRRPGPGLQNLGVENEF